MTSITASATSAVTSARRTRWRPALPPSRVPSFRALTRSTNRLWIAGATPKRTPVATDTTNANSSTGQIDRQLAGPRQAGRIGEHERSKGHPGQPEADSAASDRQQGAFGDRLLDQAAATGAERRAHRELAATRLGARQHEAREIRARNQQDEPGGGLQQPDRRDGRRRASRPAAAAAAASGPGDREGCAVGTCPGVCVTGSTRTP